MGLQLSLADAFRTVGLGSSSAPNARSEQSAGGFGDYLDAARSAASGGSTDAPEESAEQDREGEQNAEAPDGVTEAPKDSEAAVPVVVVPDAEVVLPLAKETPSDAEAPPPLPPSNDNPVVGSKAGPDTRPLIHAEAPPSVGGAVDEPAVESEGRPEANRATTSGAPDRAVLSPSAASDDTAQKTDEHSAARPDVGAEPRESAREPVSVGARKQPSSSEMRSDERGSYRSDSSGEKVSPTQVDVEPQDPARKATPRGPVSQPTLHEQKVDAWIAGRREGGSSGQPRDGESGGPRSNRSGPAGAKRAGAPTTQAGRGEAKRATLQALRTISTGAGHGDGAAAAMARFLVAQTPAGSEAGRIQPVDPPIGTATATATLSRPSSPAAAAPLAGGLLGASAPTSDPIEGIVKVLNGSNGAGRYQVTLQLDPPELGQLRLQIRMHQQVMTLHVRADRSDVARLIESRMSELRDSLSTHGIRVDRAQVVVQSPDSGDSGASHDRESGQASGEAFGQGGHHSDTSPDEGGVPGNGRQASDGEEPRGFGVNGSAPEDEDVAAVEVPTTDRSVNLVA
ncbi:MAG: flagellar hook-length control protein FliK [Phycisphaerae bacterium]